MAKELFLQLVNAWTTPQMDDKAFETACDETMCSDWSKQDIYDNCYGGYWKYYEGTYARENAYNLSRAYAIYRLSKLPYPRKVLLKTIDIGCGNRQESVSYSNFLCDWVFRKYKQVYGNDLPLYYPKDTILNEDEFIEHYRENLAPFPDR